MRAVIVEDNALLRDGLTRLLAASGIEVVAALDSAVDLVGLVAQESVGDQAGVDVVVLDVRLPPTHTTEGLQAAVELRSARPGTPVLVLSQHVERLYARQLMVGGDGAIGYLLKDRVVDVDSFVAAVREVAAGGTVLDPEVVATLLRTAERDDLLARLTPREHEVLALMAQGRSNATVAEALSVTEKAVLKHVSHIFAKLDLAVEDDRHRRVAAVLAYLDAV